MPASLSSSTSSGRRSSLTMDSSRRRSLHHSGESVSSTTNGPPSPPLAGSFTFDVFESPMNGGSHQSTPTPSPGSPFVAVDFSSDEEPTPRLPRLSSPTSGRQSSWPRTVLSFWRLTRTMLSRRALLLVLVALALVLTVVNKAEESGRDPRRYVEAVTGAPGRLKDAVEGLLGWQPEHDAANVYYEPLDPTLVLNFAEPQGSLQMQLKEGVRYATTVAYGGHANQFIVIAKLLYLAKITNRVAIIPTLLPAHFDGKPENITKFFDLDRLWNLTKVPAIEWWRVKAFDPSATPNTESISCWSIQEATVGHANNFRWSTDIHKTSVTNWALPPMLRGMGGFDIAYDALRMFDFDRRGQWEWIERVKKEALPQKKEPFHGNDLRKNLKDGFDVTAPAPTEQLFCFDNTLFLGPVMFPEPFATDPPLEAYVPGEGLSWIEISQHIYFNRDVEDRVDQYLMRIFDVQTLSQIPPFITIHLRRGDFKDFGGLTALDKYVAAHRRLVSSLQARLDAPDSWRGPGKLHFRSFGIRAEQYFVLATTDEVQGSPFIEEVRALGWKVLSHGEFQTKATFGGWWPTILDAAVLARGQSFVGTDRSTFSHLAGLRVKYWKGGLVEIAK